jgi:hypothetical protein
MGMALDPASFDFLGIDEAPCEMAANPWMPQGNISHDTPSVASRQFDKSKYSTKDPVKSLDNLGHLVGLQGFARL